MIRIVTVPLDLTADADRALGPAVAIAHQLDAVLELAVVSSPGLDHTEDEYALQARAVQHLGLRTSATVLEADDVVSALSPYFADPERIVCLATHGRGRLADVFVPSVTLALVHGSHRPAVVVGPRLAWWTGPVSSLLLGVDERGAPLTTLDVVAGYATAFDVGIDLVQTQPPDGVREEPAPGSLGVDDARTWLQARGLRVGVRRIAGEPAVSLADMAARSNASPLVAVTTRVETRRERALRGSVTSRLVAASPCPVLVVPAALEPERHTERAGLTSIEH